jgi:hypothetical protein
MSTLVERFIELIGAVTSEARRFKELEEISGIAAVSWRKAYLRGQRPTNEMIEKLGKKYPQHAFWLVTGITDPLRGHIAPHTWDSHNPVPRGVNQPTANAEFLYRIQLVEQEPIDAIELAEKRRRTEDAILDIRENAAIAATYVSYEKAMREIGEAGKSEFFVVSTDKHMHELELARRDEEQALQKRYWTWKTNLFTSQALEKAWGKLTSSLKKKK